MFLSHIDVPSISPSLPGSLEINKIFKKRKASICWVDVIVGTSLLLSCSPLIQC